MLFRSANVGANFYQTHDRIIIEAGGQRNHLLRDKRQYAAVYLRDVEGDFRADTMILSQEVTGQYAGGGLMVKNDITKPQDISGMTVGWMFPKYCVASFERPMPYEVVKTGRTFKWLKGQGWPWPVASQSGVYGDPDAVQDVGIFANAYSGKNELCRVEFKYFKLEKLISKKDVKLRFHE